jgi:hypothetical protein
MAKKFKTEENNIIWESYGNVHPNDQMYADEYNDENVFEDEDAEAIISLTPPGPMEAEFEDDDSFEDDDLFDDDDDDAIDLDNEIIVKALRKLIKRADILLNHCESDKLDTWMVAKIIKAEDYISDVWNELDDVADFANDGPKDIF